MKTITISEILGLYKKYDANIGGSRYIRNTINLGTLNNRLNTGNSFINNNRTHSVWTDNTYI